MLGFDGAEGRAGSIKEPGDRLVFDGQCPFCRAYVASLHDSDESKPATLHKIDARCNPELVEQLAAQGLDINQGIVLLKKAVRYQGAEALHLLANTHGARQGLGRLPHYVLRHRFLSFLLYPVLRTIRNIYLRLFGQAPIEKRRCAPSKRGPGQ